MALRGGAAPRPRRLLRADLRRAAPLPLAPGRGGPAPLRAARGAVRLCSHMDGIWVWGFVGNVQDSRKMYMNSYDFFYNKSYTFPTESYTQIQPGTKYFFIYFLEPARNRENN